MNKGFLAAVSVFAILLFPSALSESLSLSEMRGAEEALSAEAVPAPGAEAGESAPDGAVPKATGFWDMDPDRYDLSDPAHQQAIWDLLMQPIVVLDVDQKDHVYPTVAPGIDKKPWKTNTAGELHGQSQGVHVLEEDADGDGYVLIESYSNDGTKTGDSTMMTLDNARIRGYVKKSLLKTVNPSQKYALLVDKARQKLFIFEAGRIIGSLPVSTGLNNPKQPYNETPAGEFLAISWVGEMVAGTMRERFSIRINGGTTIHEVPHRLGADGKTRMYTEFEKELGKKASHACVRVARRKNAEGQNMEWLWANLEQRTKVFIWDDVGRKTVPVELPDADTPLFRNPEGGRNYHVNQNCSGVKAKFLPLSGGFTYGDLLKDEYRKLTPCEFCGAPDRQETLYERWLFEADQIGVQPTEEVRRAFGME